MPYAPEAFQPKLVRDTPDCGNTDELSGFEQPSLAGNQNFEVTLNEGTSSAVLLVGVTSTPVPLDSIGMFFCALNVDPLLTIPATPFADWTVHTAGLPLPGGPAAFGARLVMQWVWTRPTANLLGLVSSSAVQVDIR